MDKMNKFVDDHDDGPHFGGAGLSDANGAFAIGGAGVGAGGIGIGIGNLFHLSLVRGDSRRTLLLLPQCSLQQIKTLIQVGWMTLCCVVCCMLCVVCCVVLCCASNMLTFFPFSDDF